METFREKAEAYVREQCPELMELSFGCEIQDKYSKVKYKATDVPHPMEGLSHWDFVPLQGFENAQNTLSYEIIGHPIQLQHWLRVLGGGIQIILNAIVDGQQSFSFTKRGFDKSVRFNLTTGQPATEDDYKAFCEIVGI